MPQHSIHERNIQADHAHAENTGQVRCFADTLDDQTRRRYRGFGIAACCFGCFTEVLMDSTAIFILYMTALGASNTVTMLSTSFTGLGSMLFYIPASGLVSRFGYRKTVSVSGLLAFFAYMMMAAAPLAGESLARHVALVGCLAFCLTRSVWGASWYYVLSQILRPCDRAGFFGFLRFCYFTATGTTFFVVGLMMGKEPPRWFLQAVLAGVGCLVLLRNYFISRIQLPDEGHGTYDVRKALGISVRNAPLVGFAIYVCFLCISFNAVIPLALLYLKKGLEFNSNLVQILSTVGIAGSVSGYLLYSVLVRRMGIRLVELAIHALYILIPIGFFCCFAELPGLPYVAGVLLYLAYLALALFGCTFSQEILALGRPGNATMATALVSTYQNIGIFASRTGSSLLLGHGILSVTWKCGSYTATQFQTIFLICAALAVCSLVILLAIPSIIPKHDDFYNP